MGENVPIPGIEFQREKLLKSILQKSPSSHYNSGEVTPAGVIPKLVPTLNRIAGVTLHRNPYNRKARTTR